MSVFKKLKDVLFDIEEEEELPIIEKQRSKPVIDENPIKEVKMPIDEPINKQVPKETGFNFPLDVDEEIKPKKREKFDYFDDDFDRNLFEKKQPAPRKKEVEDYNFSYTRPRRDEKKSFKPSPVISPVYGVLDQNYTKDDVIVKTDIGVKGPDLDEVRKKAYAKTKKVTPVEIEKDEEDEFSEPLKTLDDILKDNPKKERKSVIADEPLDEELLKEEMAYDDELPDEPYKDEQDKLDDTLEKDLFNLIDSMYEESNEEE